MEQIKHSLELISILKVFLKYSRTFLEQIKNQ